MMQTAINNNMEKSITMKSIVIQAYVWLALPLLIFLAFWVIPWISVPAITAIILILAKIFREKSDSQLYKSRGFAASLRFDRNIWWIILVILLVSIYCGIGGLYSQSETDAFGRNAVFYDLVKFPWPTQYPPLDGNPRFMIYYFGFWLPAALIAKMFGGSVFAGEMVQIVYAAWGVWLITAFLFSYCHGRRRWFTFLLLFFYCGWEILQSIILWERFMGDYTFMDFYIGQLDSDNPGYSMMTMHITLIHIYNQAIPAIFGFALLYYQRNCLKYFLFTFSLLMIFAPIPALGILPVCVIWCLRNFRRALTLINIFGILLTSLIAIFYMGNSLRTMSCFITSSYEIIKLAKYCCIWLFIDVAVYIPFIWNRVKHNRMFMLLLLISILGPLFSLHGRSDFGWRLTSGLAVFLMFTVIKAAVYVRNWRTPRNICFAIVLALGATGPIVAYSRRSYFEIKEVIIEGKSPRNTLIEGHLSDKDYPGNWIYVNYIAERGSFFYRYLMRRDRSYDPKPAQ